VSVALIISQQGVGNLLAAATAWALIASDLPRDWVWRLAFGLGSVPGILTLYWRWRMHETKAFASEQRHDREQAAADAAKDTSLNRASHHAPSGLRRTLLALWEHSGQLLGTCVSWFLFDVTFYANSLSNSSVLEAAGFGDQEHLATVARGTTIIAAIAVPGYFMGAFSIDRFGRRTLQIGGFLLMAATLITMASSLKPLERSGGFFLFVYGLTFLFSNIGPNITTYVIPSELYPTRVRSTCSGLSAASGKLGAVLGGAALTPLLKTSGLATVLFLCGGTAVVGALWTWAFVEDMAGIALENPDDTAEDVQRRNVEQKVWWRRAPLLDYVRTFFPNYAGKDSLQKGDDIHALSPLLGDQDARA
jgi:MFS family permease